MPLQSVMVTALHLALVALGLGPGDEVIVQHVASVNAISCRASVFVDSEMSSWQIDQKLFNGKLPSEPRYNGGSFVRSSSEYE